MTARHPVTVYLMPWGRVGSNLVNSIMGQHAATKVWNEPLTRLDSVGRSKDQSDDEIWQTQADWLKTYILDAAGTGPIFLNLAAVHIKKPIEFVKLLAPTNPVYMVHDRRDVVATVISAMRTNAWVQEGVKIGEKRSWAIPKGASVNFRPYLAPADFKKMVGVVDNGRAIIKTVTEGQNATTYYYEDLMDDMDGVITDVFAKARIPFQNYEVRSAKFGSQYLEDMVANPAELAKVIVASAVPTALILDGEIR